ncbi:hypothetical protein PLICRDRAFT_30412 [Plicaturopsis crispa FD-325 SS-3]|nr:hypothetical protein PLICRDRAFT_30412 [Plicaturopsis crispa FD-325 SS-3]
METEESVDHPSTVPASPTPKHGMLAGWTSKFLKNLPGSKLGAFGETFALSSTPAGRSTASLSSPSYVCNLLTPVQGLSTTTGSTPRRRQRSDEDDGEREKEADRKERTMITKVRVVEASPFGQQHLRESLETKTAECATQLEQISDLRDELEAQRAKNRLQQTMLQTFGRAEGPDFRTHAQLVETLEREKLRAEAAAEETKAQLIATDVELKDLKDRIEQLKNSKSEAQKDFAKKLNEDIAAAVQGESTAQASKLRDLHSRIEALETEKTSLESNFSVRLQTEKDNAKKALDAEFDKELKEAIERATKDAQAESRTLRSRIEALEADQIAAETNYSTRLQTEKDNTKKALDAEFDKELKEATERATKDAQVESQTLQSRIRALEAEKTSLESDFSVRLQTEKDNAKKALDAEFDKELKEATERATKDAQVESQTLLSRIEALEADQIAAETNYSTRLQTEKDNAKKALDAEFDKELKEAVERATKDAQAESQTLQSRIEALQGLKAEKTAVETNFSTSLEREKGATKKVLIAEYSKQMKDARVAKENAEALLQTVRSQLETLQTEKDTLKTDFAKHLQDAELETQSARAESQTLLAEMETLKAEKTAVETSYSARLQTEKDIAKKALDAAFDKELKEAIERATKDAQAESRTLRSRIEGLKAEKTAGETSYSARLQTEKDNAKKALDAEYAKELKLATERETQNLRTRLSNLQARCVTEKNALETNFSSRLLEQTNAAFTEVETLKSKLGVLQAQNPGPSETEYSDLLQQRAQATAASVQSYLIEQGVPDGNVIALVQSNSALSLEIAQLRAQGNGPQPGTRDMRAHALVGKVRVRGRTQADWRKTFKPRDKEPNPPTPANTHRNATAGPSGMSASTPDDDGAGPSGRSTGRGDDAMDVSGDEGSSPRRTQERRRDRGPEEEENGSSAEGGGRGGRRHRARSGSGERGGNGTQQSSPRRDKGKGKSNHRSGNGGDDSDDGNNSDDRSPRRGRKSNGHRSGRDRDCGDSSAGEDEDEDEDEDEEPKKKRRPLSRTRRACLALTRHTVREALGIETDKTVFTCSVTDAITVQAFVEDHGPGPSFKNLPMKLDPAGGINSPWTVMSISNLAGVVLERSYKDPKVKKRKDLAYFEEMVRERFRHLIDMWKEMEPRVTKDLVWETPEQAAERFLEHHKVSGVNRRDRARLATKFNARLSSIAAMAIATEEAGAHDASDKWHHLHTMVETLTVHGMSSEESSEENGFEVMRVRNMPWRRPIGPELQLIDSIHTKKPELFAAGAKPVPRTRDGDRQSSRREAVRRLPTSFYDAEWLKGQTSWGTTLVNPRDKVKFDFIPRGSLPPL